MTAEIHISEQTTALTQLMRQKLRVRGNTLPIVLARGKYRLPKRIVRAVNRLIEAETMAENPRLQMMLDHQALDASIREVERFLADIDPSDERKGWYLGILASLVINLLTLAILLIAVMLWQGYL